MTGKLSEVEEKALGEFKEILVGRFGENIRAVRLFGSKARGDFRKESDINLLVKMLEREFRRQKDFWGGLKIIWVADE